MFQENQTEVQGLKITYYTIGEGTPILFLHGGLVDAKNYENNIISLTKYGKVIAPDIPGFGKSETQDEAWDFTQYANFIKDFISKINLSEKLIVVGHSLGGGIALHFSLNNPQVKKVILINSAGIQITETTLDFIYNFFIKKTRHDISENYESHKIARNKALASLRNHLGTLPTIVRSARKCLLLETPKLTNIHAQTLILWGKGDEIFPLTSAEKLHEGIKGSILKTFDSNHSWCLAKPQEFEDAIKEFLS